MQQRFYFNEYKKIGRLWDWRTNAVIVVLIRLLLAGVEMTMVT